MRSVKCIYLILVVFSCIGALAQQPSYIHFNVNNSLPSNNVYYASQDKSGYFWFATDKGVVRFNGYNFNNYTTNEGLSDNEIFDIYQDSKDRIWFSCYNGEPSFYKDGTFHNRSNSNLLAQSSHFNIGLKVMEDNKGNIYYLSQKAIAVFKGNGEFDQKKQNETIAYSTLIKNEQNEVLSIKYDTSNVYISNLTSGHTESFSHQRKKVMPMINTKADIIGNTVYYGVHNKLVVKRSTSKVFEIATEFTDMIQFIRKESNTTLWIGTQNGLYLYDVVKNVIKKRIFSGHSISSVFTDNEMHTWITTLDDGIFLVLNQDVELLNASNSLSFNNSLNLMILDNQSLLIGSNNFRFAVLGNGAVSNINLPVSQGNGLIRSVRSDKFGNFYIVTAVEIIKLNNRFEMLKKYKTATRDLLFLNDDSLYIARINGVFKVKVSDLDKHANDLDAFFIRNIHLKHSANYFYKSESGNLYCIGNKGIKKMNGKREPAIENDTLFKNNITSLVESGNGVLFVSSDINGIKAVYNGRNFYINNKSGLPSNFVTSLAFDSNNNLWAGTTNGLAKVEYTTVGGEIQFKITNYSTINGLIDNSINDVIFYKDKIWLATNFGVCSFKEKDLSKKSVAPAFRIESIIINDSIYGLGTNTIVSPYNKNNFKIKYVGISSGSLNNIKYSYRMNGLDENWNTTSNTQLQYPSLPPGNYTFEIKALNRQGEASSTSYLYITIVPAFYQTIWFRLLVAIALLLLTSFIIIFRIRVRERNHLLKANLLRSENKQLEMEKEEINMQMKLMELEQKALRLHMNPHFLFNAINAINGFYASGEAELGKRYITKLSQLLRMLLDYSTQKIITLKQETDLLHNYFLLNQLRFQNKFDYSIEIGANLNPEIVAIPPMIIQPFVENALIHGIAPLKTKGMVKVNIEKSDNYLICTISDNGIGRKKSNELNADKIHKSTGIKVTEERIKASVDAEEYLSIEDITNAAGVCIGTKVIFKINYQEMF